MRPSTRVRASNVLSADVRKWHQPAVSAYSSAFPLLEVNRRWCGEADPSQFDPIRKFWLFELRQVVKGDQFAEAELCYLAQAFRSLLRGQPSTLGELELSLPEGLHLLGAAHEGEPDRIRRVSGTRAAEARCCAAAAAAKPDRRQPKVPAASPAFVLSHLQRLAVSVPSPISRRMAVSDRSTVSIVTTNGSLS